MVFAPLTVFLFAGSFLSVNAQTTPAPAATPAPASLPPLTELTFTYPNVVSSHFQISTNAGSVVLKNNTLSLVARESQPLSSWTRPSVRLQYLQLDDGKPLPRKPSQKKKLRDYHFHISRRVRIQNVRPCSSTTSLVRISRNDGFNPIALTCSGTTDFCLWGSPTANGVIGNVEAIVVAYCSKAGHGTRIMPEGTLTAVYVLFFLTWRPS